MFGLLLPLYTSTPRDEAGVQWRPLTVRTANIFLNTPTTINWSIDVPNDENWIINTFAVIVQSTAAVVGPPAYNNSVPFHLFVYFAGRSRDAEVVVTSQFNLIVPQLLGDTYAAVFLQLMTSDLFAPAGTEIKFRMTFQSTPPGPINPGVYASTALTGLIFPRGNMSQ